MKIRCVWEHNGNDSILYADNFTGAFTRGKSLEEAMLKMPDEIRRFQLWKGESPSDFYDIEVIQEKASDLQIKDADSDVLFKTEEAALSAEEYQSFKALAMKSAEDFHTLYSYFPSKTKVPSPLERRFTATYPIPLNRCISTQKTSTHTISPKSALTLTMKARLFLAEQEVLTRLKTIPTFCRRKR